MNLDELQVMSLEELEVHRDETLAYRPLPRRASEEEWARIRYIAHIDRAIESALAQKCREIEALKDQIIEIAMTDVDSGAASANMSHVVTLFRERAGESA